MPRTEQSFSNRPAGFVHPNLGMNPSASANAPYIYNGHVNQRQPMPSQHYRLPYGNQYDANVNTNTHQQAFGRQMWHQQQPQYHADSARYPSSLRQVDPSPFQSNMDQDRGFFDNRASVHPRLSDTTPNFLASLRAGSEEIHPPPSFDVFSSPAFDSSPATRSVPCGPNAKHWQGDII